MAVLDMFGRPIEKGDMVVRLVPRCDPLIVIDVKEPSLLGANPQQIPMGELKLSMVCGEPIPNPARMPNVQFNDIMIVRKGTESASVGRA